MIFWSGMQTVGSVKIRHRDENVEKNYFGIKYGKRKINATFF